MSIDLMAVAEGGGASGKKKAWTPKAIPGSAAAPAPAPAPKKDVDPMEAMRKLEELQLQNASSSKAKAKPPATPSVRTFETKF